MIFKLLKVKYIWLLDSFKGLHQRKYGDRRETDVHHFINYNRLYIVEVGLYVEVCRPPNHQNNTTGSWLRSEFSTTLNSYLCCFMWQARGCISQLCQHLLWCLAIMPSWALWNLNSWVSSIQGRCFCPLLGYYVESTVPLTPHWSSSTLNSCI